jgi:hypothetical protein
MLHIPDAMADIYSELQPERREIRLMFLDAGQPQDGITASLLVTSLRWAHEYWTPEYEALSYVWGDPLITCPIKLNCQPYQVTENLEVALRRLRHVDRVRILWIDAVCINQRNPREQEHQIGLMHDIFEGCTSCIVWLGEEDDETERALDSLHWMQDNLHVHEWPCFDKSKGGIGNVDVDGTYGVGPALGPLQRFLRRPWFSRTWTFQEFILPRKHEIRCGHFHIPFSLLDRSQRQFAGHSYPCCGYGSNSHMEAVVQVQTQLDQIVFPLGATRRYLQTYEGHDFLHLLEDNCHRIATRAHDKVYGLIGLAPMHVRDSILPDYELDVATVYAQPIVAFMQTYTSLRPLVSVRQKNNNLNLPSWVPDWSCFTTNEIPHWRRRSRYVLFNACRHNQIFRPVIYDYRVLKVRGVKCDAVETMGQILRTSSDRGAILANWYEMATSEQNNQSSSSNTRRHNAFWRTTLFDVCRQEINGGAIQRATENDYKALHVIFGSFDGDSQKPSEAHTARLENELYYNMREARFMMTTSGWLGMVPLNTQIGDGIYILAGGQMPFVLRRSNVTFSPRGSSDAGRLCYTLVGECYLDQLMDGEFSNRLRTAAVDIFIV